jgi:hypothetical protein
MWLVAKVSTKKISTVVEAHDYRQSHIAKKSGFSSMLYSFQIVILHTSKGALLKILVSHEYLHSVTALYVELLFIRCLCIDTACRSLPSMSNNGTAGVVAHTWISTFGRRFGRRFSDDIVTGAIVCSRVTYSICRYDNNNKSKRGYSYEDIRENICCDFKRNNILDRCYRDEERNTPRPYAPGPLYPPVFSPHPLPLCLPSPTSFATYLRVLPLIVRGYHRLRFHTLPVSNIFATSLVTRRPLLCAHMHEPHEGWDECQERRMVDC